MSKVEIINRALLKLGEPPVSSLNDAAFGKSYETIYEDVKNLLLSSYPWRFAVGVKRLARSEKTYGDRFMYPLPADCLLLLKVFGQGARDLTEARPYAMQGYELADNCIVSPLKDGVEIEYVRAVGDDAAFPPLFREAAAAKVAAAAQQRDSQRRGTYSRQQLGSGSRGLGRLTGRRKIVECKLIWGEMIWCGQFKPELE